MKQVRFSVWRGLIGGLCNRIQCRTTRIRNTKASSAPKPSPNMFCTSSPKDCAAFVRSNYTEERKMRSSGRWLWEVSVSLSGDLGSPALRENSVQSMRTDIWTRAHGSVSLVTLVRYLVTRLLGNTAEDKDGDKTVASHAKKVIEARWQLMEQV